MKQLLAAIKPTPHFPKSPAKLEVMKFRALMGLPLFMTGDAELTEEMDVQRSDDELGLPRGR